MTIRSSFWGFGFPRLLPRRPLAVHSINLLLQALVGEIRRLALAIAAIEVGQQFIRRRRLRLHAIRRHIDMRDPDDAIENTFAEFIAAPVEVVMGAGAAKAAPVVVALGHPDQML